MRAVLISTILALAAAAAAPATAIAHDVRERGTCGRGASSQLRLADHSGKIRVEFEVRARHAHQRWHVVLVHERRVVWRGRARSRSGSSSYRVRRTVADYAGADQVRARATGPHGNTCAAIATLPGP